MKEIITNSREETYELGKSLALDARPGDIYCLDGDLGAGKTALAQGFAAGLGITEPVSSPTFTVLKEYDSGRFPLYHFDVYRIEDPDEMEEISFFDKISSGEGMTLIEWAHLIDDIIPGSAVRIIIERVPASGPDVRKITIK